MKFDKYELKFDHYIYNKSTNYTKLKYIYFSFLKGFFVDQIVPISQVLDSDWEQYLKVIERKNPSGLEYYKQKELDSELKKSVISVHNFYCALRAVTSYLLLFYNYNYLIEEYRHHFQYLSYDDYLVNLKNHSENRFINMINKGLATVKDKAILNSPIRITGSKHLHHQPIKDISKEDVEMKDHYIDIGLNPNFLLFEIIDYVQKDFDGKKSEKHVNSYVINGFIELFTNDLLLSPHVNLSNSLYNINTQSPSIAFEVLKKSMVHDYIPEPRLVQDIDSWDDLMKWLTTKVVQFDLYSEMKSTFEVDNHFTSQFPEEDGPTIAKKYGKDELLKCGPCSKNHLKHILTSKSFYWYEEKDSEEAKEKFKKAIDDALKPLF